MAAPRLHPFWRLVLAVLAVLCASVVTGVVISLFLHLASRLRLIVLPSQEQLIHDYGLTLATLGYPLALWALWWFRTRVDKRSWSSLGFTRSRALANFARGALVGFATLGVLFSLLWLAGAVRFGGLSGDVLTRGWGFAILSLLTYFVAFVGVGFMEEIAFRGYALHNLSEWLGWKWAVGVQAVVFALIHLGNARGDHEARLAALGALPSLALIAVLFAMSYRKTGSLWFAIGFHTLWNWSLGCVFSLPVSGVGTFRLFNIQSSGQSFLSGGKFGAEGSFFLIPILLAMIYFLSLAPNHPRALADLQSDEPQRAPVPVPVAVPLADEETEEEPRENRFRARFGSGEGFDSGMLRELKTMQEERERTERERRETDQALRRAEQERRIQTEAQTVAEAPAPVEEARVEREVPVAVVAQVEEAPAPVAQIEDKPVAPLKTIAPSPRVETPKPVAPAPPTEPSETPPKKARPRW